MKPDRAGEHTMRWRYATLFILCVIALLVWVLVFVDAYTRERAQIMRVVFLDVGQGDAIYIESPTGTQMLIDGGRDRTILRRLTSEMGFFDRSIDFVLMTHEDLDHVGGLPHVLSRFAVSSIIRTENQGGSDMAALIDTKSDEEEAEIIYARRGMTFDLGGGAVLRILFPDRDPHDLESNTSSIVARLTYGDNEFLFTGDSPQEIEEYLVSLDCHGLQSDVLKAGHHGSRTSTSESFLSCVRPDTVVISAGKDNRYGHPHKEVVDRVHAYDADMLATPELGTIILESDGQDLVQVR